MAGGWQKPLAVATLALLSCWLCVVQGEPKADVKVTAFLLEPASSLERSATLLPVAPGFGEDTRFGKTQVFDAPLLSEPDTNSFKIGAYRGFLMYTSITERSVLVTAAAIFTDGVRYPAGTRLHLQGTFETQTLSNGEAATLSIIGGTGPLRRATGYATYELVPGAGAPGELIFRLTLYVYLQQSGHRHK